MSAANKGARAKSPNGQPSSTRALVDLKAQELLVNGVRHALSPGMQVTAEIHLGTGTILEYLLSPVMGAFQEAGRERWTSLPSPAGGGRAGDEGL
jgi:HlyD family secretion protein